ncbi:hypothetical protein [Ferruginibacter sp. HRS2-29]|uniref:hypothetical protein n=1 Tax=Ferruginibacter sp. HRS2-29 TaxID=2487334 RepID=UPI0020CB9DB2|nr:hypothetical protein [Ferruginibacter sp. HRS2-29]MCP9753539.1 hypothetical protein [Ferruginibacter sp. HRS2-29]
MKQYFLLLMILAASVKVQAQLTDEQRIQDSVLGWWSVQDIKNIPKVHESHGETFTVKTQMDMKYVIEWMKKSYIPVGGLGWFKRKFYVNDYSFPPHSYGVDFRVWNVSFSKEFLDAKGNFTPIAEEYTSFGFDVNSMTGSNAINFMNSPTQYLFTWQPDGHQGSAMDKIAKTDDPRKHPNVQKYLTRVTENSFTVYLVPDNKLPILQVTKGEYLRLADAAIDNQLLKEKQDVEAKWPGDVKAQNDAYDYRKKDLERYRAGIKKWLQVYKNSLNEPAILRDMQPNIRSFDLDPFAVNDMAKNLKQFYPVYKLDADILAKCKADKPQWIAVWFPIETKEDGNQQYEMYRSMLEHFNYDYVYNYFFDPEKIKGIAYKPANEALLNATLERYRKKSNGRTTAVVKQVSNVALPSNVYFMDDFTSNAAGSKPSGWYFSTIGKHAVVTTLSDQKGNWLQLGYNNEVTPTTLKKPLPQNFTLEYDMATSDFAGRYGGSAILVLDTWNANTGPNKAPTRATLKIEIGAGNENDFNNNNYRGYLNIDLNKVPEVNENNYNKGDYYKNELRAFTNKKSKVHVALKINRGEITVFINDKKTEGSKELKLAYGGDCKDCTIPAGLNFNSIYWKNTTSDEANVNVYISNVKITKE